MELPSEKKLQSSEEWHLDKVYRELKENVIPRRIILEPLNKKITKLLIFFFAICCFFTIILFFVRFLFPYVNEIVTIVSLLLFLIIVGIFAFFFTYFVVRYSVKESKSNLKASKFIDNAKDEFIRTYGKVFEGLAVERDVVLKSIELHFDILYKKSQEEQKTRLDISSIFLSFILVLSIVIVYPFPSEAKLLLIATCMGGFAGIIPVVKSFLSTIEPHNKSVYEDCLLTLKMMRLRNKLNSNLVNNDLTIPQSQGEAKSIMSKLRDVKIDGPEDFAANIDLYLSGEKRIDENLH